MLSRPPGFTYNHAELHCERLPVRGLAEKFGTPVYLYSTAALKQPYQAFDRAFRDTPHTICYSVKANSNLSLLRLLARMGAAFDIVSGGELERVRVASKSAVKKIVFSGVGKTAEELQHALRAGILLFNMHSATGLELLPDCAARLKKTAGVALRVNPDVPAETPPYISPGFREHKFGVPMGEAPAPYRPARSEERR